MGQYRDEDHVKETYAHFGLAYYASNVLESGLATAIMQLEFLEAVKDRRLQQDGRRLTRIEFEDEFDNFMHQQHAQSLGNLIRKIRQFEAIGEDLKELMQEVKTKRDFLAHHFFREHAMDLLSYQGRNKMIRELEYNRELFRKADNLLDQYMKPTLEGYGFTEAMVQEMQDKMMQEARSEG